jgi:hypothetical protein
MRRAWDGQLEPLTAILLVAVFFGLIGNTPSVSSAGNISLTWPGGGILQNASAVTGPWTNVTGAASPYVIPVNQLNSFYRLVVPAH